MPRITDDSKVQQVKLALKQRLQYSFEFDEQQAQDELQFLFASKSVYFNEEHYVMQPRLGASKTLNRTEKRKIYKYFLVILEDSKNS